MRTTRIIPVGTELMDIYGNKFTVVSKDQTHRHSMDRDIMYTVFTDRVKRIPTQEEFNKAMTDEYHGEFINHIKHHTMAIWHWEIKNYRLI